MLKNLIILPDGTELYSGRGQYNNIHNTKITKCVNSETELTLGSVCAAMLECKLQTPGGGLNIAEGTEISLYKVDDSGMRHKVGLFTMEKPTRPSAHAYRITAYDRVSWLDKDLTGWLAALDDWPYTVSTFAAMVCEACGLTLTAHAWLNGDYEIQQFIGEGITGRQLMKWIGEIEAAFVRADADGEIELGWYARSGKAITPTGTGASATVDITDDGDGNVTVTGDITVTDDGEGNIVIVSNALNVSDDGNGNVSITAPASTCIPYMGGTLAYEDYEVHPVEQVQLRLSGDDIGVVYPETDSEDLNVYTITGNYLLTTTDPTALQPVAENIYNAIKDFTYTPCEVKIWANLDIDAGQIINITDRNGVTINTCVMTMTQSGQSQTLECTGSARRDGSAVVNNLTMGALNAKMLEIRKDISGINVRASDVETRIEDNRAYTNEKIAEVTIQANGIASAVEDVRDAVDGVEAQISTIAQTAEDISLRVEKIVEDGVDKVKTSFGLTIDESAVVIARDGAEMKNRLDETGMYVTRTDGTVVLKAAASGVETQNLQVRGYADFFGLIRKQAWKDEQGRTCVATLWTGGE